MSGSYTHNILGKSQQHVVSRCVAHTCFLSTILAGRTRSTVAPKAWSALTFSSATSSGIIMAYFEFNIEQSFQVQSRIRTSVISTVGHGSEESILRFIPMSVPGLGYRCNRYSGGPYGSFKDTRSCVRPKVTHAFCIVNH